jgi:hypothetical protein
MRLTPKFYHGGAAGLSAGGFILPPDESGTLTLARQGRAYITIDPLVAAWVALVVTNGGDSAIPTVYEVVPVGRLGPDDDDSTDVNFTCRRARIVACHAVVKAVIELYKNNPEAFETLLMLNYSMRIPGYYVSEEQSSNEDAEIEALPFQTNRATALGPPS